MNVVIATPLRLVGGGASASDTQIVCPQGNDAALEFMSGGCVENLSITTHLGACLLHHQGHVFVNRCVLRCRHHPLEHLSFPIMCSSRRRGMPGYPGGSSTAVTGWPGAAPSSLPGGLRGLPSQALSGSSSPLPSSSSLPSGAAPMPVHASTAPPPPSTACLQGTSINEAPSPIAASVPPRIVASAPSPFPNVFKPAARRDDPLVFRDDTVGVVVASDDPQRVATKPYLPISDPHLVPAAGNPPYLPLADASAPTSADVSSKNGLICSRDAGDAGGEPGSGRQQRVRPVAMGEGRLSPRQYILTVADTRIEGSTSAFMSGGGGHVLENVRVIYTKHDAVHFWFGVHVRNQHVMDGIYS
eukprot:jgi/Mesvir1/18571/Mv17081-RA.2